jgi:glycosyltransferase involved in cell wall biosynthesis
MPSTRTGTPIFHNGDHLRVRIVHLTPELPAAAGWTGGATRQFHLLRRLAERGHDVVVIAPVQAAQERFVAELDETGMRIVASRRPPSRLRESLAALVREPALVAAAATRPVLGWQADVFWERLRPLAIAAVREHNPDVLSIEHDYAARWMKDLPARPAVLTFQNVGWHFYGRRAQAVQGIRRRAFVAEARRALADDRRTLDRFGALVTVSRDDAEEIARRTGRTSAVVPNGVDTRSFAATEDPGDATILFTGTLSHPPNAEGIAWFVEHVWPDVVRERDDTRLRIVGRDPPPTVTRLASERVEVTGFVEDMRPYFELATVVVVPLLSGGGTRLKVLDAFAARRAVISTRVGAEGIEADDDTHLLLRDGPRAFAHGVLSLLDDRAKRQELAAAARALAETVYDWQVLADRLERVLQGAAR